MRFSLFAALLFAAGLAFGGERAGYDPLPTRFADMDQYDQIAMEPYKDRYDSMSVDEKVRAYGQVFEFMRNRPPRFSPEVMAAAERHERLRQSRSAFETRQHLYRAPPADPARSEARVLGGLPGPWGPSAGSAAGEENFDDGAIMESLRFGTGAARRARE